MKTIYRTAELLRLFGKDRLVRWKTPLYKTGFLFGIIYLFHSIWSQTRAEFSEEALLLYLVYCEAIVLSIGPIHRSIHELIQNDELWTWMTDPHNFINSLRIEGLTAFVFHFLTLFILGTGFAFILKPTVVDVLQVRLALPALLALFSGWILISIYTLLGMSSAWLGHPSSLGLVVQKLTIIMGGVLAPLSFYPPMAELVFANSPFGATLYNIGRTILSPQGLSVSTVLLIVIYLAVFEAGVRALTAKLRTFDGGQS